MVRLTIKEALEKSIIKWKIVVEENEGCQISFGQAKQHGLEKFISYCGLCQKYAAETSKRYSEEEENYHGCSYCPLCPISPLYHKKYDEKLSYICCKEFYNWTDTPGRNKLKPAKKMLRKLKKVYKERYQSR